MTSANSYDIGCLNLTFVGLTQIGIRNISATFREGYEDARRTGSDILSIRQFRAPGVNAVHDRVPAGIGYDLTVAIDGLARRGPVLGTGSR